MAEKQDLKDAIQRVITALMEGVMDKVLKTDPFIPENHHAKVPLYAALVPDEIFKGSHFERRFTTPFGSVWEKLAVVVGRIAVGHAESQFRIRGQVRRERLRRIHEVLAKLEHGGGTSGNSRVRPDWQSELGFVLAGDGEPIPTEVICDVYSHDAKAGRRRAFELKAPLPNSDQTKVSKEKLLKLYSMEPLMVDEAYYALPYNPYGKREDYAWSFPGRWFDMRKDPVVLIGDEFWNTIGQGSYEAFVNAVNEVGPKYKERIYREFLQIEPPETAEAEGYIIREARKPYG